MSSKGNPILLLWNFILGKIFGNPGKHVTQEWIDNSNFFCMLPWVHLHITQAGTATPCCQTPWGDEHAYGNINKQSIKDIWQSGSIKQIRTTMLKDKPDGRCERCYLKERSGLFSLRKSSNLLYAHHLKRVFETRYDGSIGNSNPVFFDFRFSNFCNFKCRICGPGSSSSWYHEAKELGYTIENNRVTHAIADEDDFFQTLKEYLPFTEEIYFAGGEPTLMEQHYRLLDMLLEVGNTEVLLRYSTNFSGFIFRGKSVLDYWKKFKRVDLFASLDDSGKRGEYQRKGQKWEEVLINRELLKKECPHVKFSLAPTVSILNVYHLPSFHREFVEIGFIEMHQFLPSVLEEPYEYNIKALPDNMKNKVKLEFERHIDWLTMQDCSDIEAKKFVIAEYGHVLNFMFSANLQDRLPRFRYITNQLDKLRNESTAEIIPELSDEKLL